MDDLRERVAKLDCWRGDAAVEPLQGGLTNTNFLVRNDGRKYVVRAGQDIPEHLILRFNELAAARAAEAIGLSPAIVHAQPGILVMRFIEGRTLTEDDIRNPQTLSRILPLIQQCHHEMKTAVRGPVLAFWPFHVIRSYAHTLCDGHSRMAARVPVYLDMAEQLEQAATPTQIVFGHNDLLAANFIDDGERLWLLDWDYAGYNSPLFDLGGLSSNSNLTEAQERFMLKAYFGGPVTDRLWYQFQAMKCTSLLREAMWSMVSEICSTIDADYRSYTEENLHRLDLAWRRFTWTTAPG